ncbi:hypothetical protein PHMEG_00027607 [Phytophthora megakarya]|uniref:Bzip transcription factor n=1 Tax=Phytophthora megakarya TaxID=4795 RepID=A0A225V850_9STRA|nr:hypothetical protein PHMEG_00027607 [Phytophthora megakarya]
MYQARYRRQYREKVATLEHDIQHLRAETQGLELQCHLGFSVSGVDDSVWMVAAEYFRLFQYGFRSSIPVLRTSYNMRATSGTVPSVESRMQQEFLRENMAPDLAEELITGWTLRSLYHADLNMELQCLEAGAENTLIATANVSTTINETTLRHAFPHLTHDAEGGEWSLLATKLLCQQVTTTVSIQFEWDHTCRRVTSLLCKVDMLTPLLDLLGNLEDVSRVFDNAFIALDGSLVSRKIY